MVRKTKRTVALYIASIVVVWPQPGSAHAQQKPESSLSALFPVAGHASVDPGRLRGVRTDAATLSSDPRPGRQLVDNDADGGKVFAVTALVAVAADIAAMSIVDDVCVDNCSHGPGIGEAVVIYLATGLGVPPLAAEASGGDGRWALLGSAVGLVGATLIGGKVYDAVNDKWSVDNSKPGKLPSLAVGIGIHATVAALFALK